MADPVQIDWTMNVRHKPVRDPVLVDNSSVRRGAISSVLIGAWLKQAVPGRLAVLLFVGVIPALGIARSEAIFSHFCSEALRQIGPEDRE